MKVWPRATTSLKVSGDQKVGIFLNFEINARSEPIVSRGEWNPADMKKALAVVSISFAFRLVAIGKKRSIVDQSSNGFFGSCGTSVSVDPCVKGRLPLDHLLTFEVVEELNVTSPEEDV